MTEEPEARRKGPTRSEAFLAQAMSAFGDAVYRLALSQTRLKADAEDVYQDVFLRLYNDKTAFASDDHLKAWLLRVTINRCRDLARSSWKRRSVAFDPERDDIAAPIRDEKDAAVWDAIGQLPEQLRAAVNLHYVEGYSTEEIAGIMQCRPATARTWLFRARSRMRELLAPSKDHAPTRRTADEEIPFQPLNTRSEPASKVAPLPSVALTTEPFPKGDLA